MFALEHLLDADELVLERREDGLRLGLDGGVAVEGDGQLAVLVAKLDLTATEQIITSNY